MKKITYLLMVALLAIGFTSCCNKKETAAEAAKKYTEKIRDGKYDEFVEIIAFEPVIHVDTVKKQKAEYSDVMKTHHQPKVEQKGGIKDVAVVSEKVADDGKSANVVVANTYNNGDTENVEYAMLLDEDEWKLRLGHDKEVWTTHLADGTKETFKLKHDAHRDILKEHEQGEDREFVKEEEFDNKDVLKVKDGEGDRDVVKVKDKDDEIVVKEIHDGEKEVTRIPKEE